MLIVINALSARLGGGQTYVKNLLAHLPERPDLRILIYAPASLQLPQDSRIHECDPRWPTKNPILRSLWEKLILPRILARKNVSVLFCPGGIIVTKVSASCKSVTMFRNMIPFDDRVLARLPLGLQKIRNFLLKRVMLYSLANADLSIFVSEYARRVIANHIDIPNAVTIYHGISSEFRTYGKKIDRPFWLPSGEYILYVSRFDIYKHQMEVAKAFAGLPDALRQRYKLLFVGEADNKLAKDVEKFVEENGLGDHIRIVGAIDYYDMPAVYHHATVNLFASSCENCPNIMLEALGSGRPIISSSEMPMPEFGQDAVDYFVPTDPNNLRDQLARVLEDEDHRRKLAKSAVRRSNDFDWGKTAKITWQHIIDLASSD